jgi:hypothetical protein
MKGTDFSKGSTSVSSPISFPSEKETSILRNVVAFVALSDGQCPEYQLTFVLYQTFFVSRPVKLYSAVLHNFIRPHSVSLNPYVG